MGSAIFDKTIGSTIFVSDAEVKVIPLAQLADVDTLIKSGITPASGTTGTTVKFIDGSCATNEISFQGGQKTDIDVTSLCSTEQEVTNGLAAPAEVTLTRNWADDDPMLAELEEASEKDEVRLYIVRFQSGNGFAFLAEIRQSSWSAATAGKVAATYTLRLRGGVKRVHATRTPSIT